MGALIGQEIHAIDSKGRVSIPSKMRKALEPDANETFIVTKGYDKCLFAYPLNEWKKKEEFFKKLDQNNPDHRFILRTFLPFCVEVKLDTQQRIQLTKDLIEEADIKEKVKIIGILDHIEIWNPDNFSTYKNSRSESFEDIVAKAVSVAQ
ncbi:MAG: hypothetical protein HW421_984 [Ignavibacteria bacterium]|nr:hypothetical protein [Ignavibacteria bacterium]